MFLKFLANLFNVPYDVCESCSDLRKRLDTLRDDSLVREREESNEVKILREQIIRLESQNQQLFDRLLKLSEPEVIPTVNIPVPPRPKARTWDAQRREMEAQDRLSEDRIKEINKLEEELKINTNAPESTESKPS